MLDLQLEKATGRAVSQFLPILTYIPWTSIRTAKLVAW